MPVRSEGSRGRPGGPSLRSLVWRPLICLPVVLVLLRAPAALSGALELQLDEEQPAGTVVGDISAGLPPGGG